MKIALVFVGKTEEKALSELMDVYERRINRYVNFELVEASEEKLEKTLKKFDRVFLLDEHGKEQTSVQFSDFTQKQLNSGVKSVCFVIGGPFGFSEKIRAISDNSLTLSKMTFPHDLVRVIFLEQLYRAFSILRNEKYHHE